MILKVVSKEAGSFVTDNVIAVREKRSLLKKEVNLSKSAKSYLILIDEDLSLNGVVGEIAFTKQKNPEEWYTILFTGEAQLLTSEGFLVETYKSSCYRSI